MKIALKRGVSILLVLALVIGGTAFFSRALAMQEGPEKNGAFLQEDREYDVLLFGSSHMVNGIYPQLLWRDYGITAYNLAGHGCGLAASYWTMRLAVAQHKPKAAVLDVLFAQSNTTEMNISLAHELLDPYPLSKEKIRAVTDLYAGSADRAELLFPLDVYHNRWKELDSAMVDRGFSGETDLSPEKGAQVRVRVTPAAAQELIPQSQSMQERTLAMDYIEKFVTYCLDNDIVPVLTYLPCQISQEWQESCNAALELGRQLGAQVVDMQYMDLIDNDTDWYDEADHLNPSGVKKTTDCLGAFLRETLSLEDHRDSADWQADYARYEAFLVAQMQTCTDLNSLLSLADLTDATVTLAVPETYPLDRTTTAQLTHLGTRATVTQTQESQLTVTVSAPTGELWTTKQYTVGLKLLDSEE